MIEQAPTALAQVQARIGRAARTAGRRASDITLIAVSKTFGAGAIRPLISAGQRHFGENRVQEAQTKWPALKAETPDLVLHMIGALQSNKAGDAVALFDVIHSLDRPSLATALANAMVKLGKRPACFVQVNVGDESQKAGCAVTELPSFLGQCRALQLPVIGLMAIPPADQHPGPYFALLATLADRHGLRQLSMGMSADFEAAVQLGASHVRVGSALFGAR
jgi:PLP dependent protein